ALRFGRAKMLCKRSRKDAEVPTGIRNLFDHRPALPLGDAPGLSPHSVTVRKHLGLHELRAKRDRFMKLKIESLTPKLWPAFEDLFGKKGACNGCWCMNWRIGREYCRRSPEANKADFKAIVTRGPAPGLLAFEGDLPVGWCQLTPRSALPWLDRQWRLKRVD